MKIVEVNDNKTKRQFLDVARIIYKNDKNWVCPLDREINGIFDPKQNVFFDNGEACRWILFDDRGNLAGRVAAFINYKKAYNFQQPTGGMGFFECINNKEAAFMLFDQCEKWLSERGMKAMDGPINFGENDNYWGLLVEGFTHPGIGMNYNPPYYKQFFEDYGFKFYFEQVSNHLDLKKGLPERFIKIAEWVLKKPGYTFEHFSYKNKEKYINDFMYVYNNAWVFHENFVPIRKENLEKVLEKSKSFIEEKFIWFAYVNGEPAGFLVLFPDVNQILKHMNGKVNLWTMLKFLYYKRKKTITRGRIVIMGVLPKYQKSGIESAIFYNLKNVILPMKHYTELELSWVGDFNPKMRALHESVGAVFAKRHITYRKLFSDEIKYTRSTIIPVDTKEKYIQNNKSKSEN